MGNENISWTVEKGRWSCYNKYWLDAVYGKNKKMDVKNDIAIR